MNNEIIIVSGLPRSGTSLMMQMLAAGGIEVLTDGERMADEDNPRGYLELERVKKIKQDASWLPTARGKAIKMISQLLFDLPATEAYRVLIVQRDLEEILESQEKMLTRLGRPAVTRDKLRAAFRSHLERLDDWLGKQSHIATLRVDYATLVAKSVDEATRINQFLGGRADAGAMAKAVDPSLYRNRR